MTSKDDRRHRIQQYPKPLVIQAMNDTIYGEENLRIVNDLFVGNMTHKQVAGAVHLEERSLYKRLNSIMPPMEEYLRRIH